MPIFASDHLSDLPASYSAETGGQLACMLLVMSMVHSCLEAHHFRGAEASLCVKKHQ